jgi:hypothetical protein
MDVDGVLLGWIACFATKLKSPDLARFARAFFIY